MPNRSTTVARFQLSRHNRATTTKNRATPCLRDLFMWAYERSTQEYLAIKQDLAEPDPLRLVWRELIKQSVREVVRQPELDPLDVLRHCLSDHDLGAEYTNVEALVIEELRRLHEGVLARYGLRPSEFAQWQARQRRI